MKSGNYHTISNYIGPFQLSDSWISTFLLDDFHGSTNKNYIDKPNLLSNNVIFIRSK